MTKENKTSKYLDYGRLEFTVGYVAEGKENDTIFAVYCDESIEGEFPHDKLVGIFKTREEAVRKGKKSKLYVTTIKIEWKE